jgi:Zn-dependent peptidase ImmA (M78 family)
MSSTELHQSLSKGETHLQEEVSSVNWDMESPMRPWALTELTDGCERKGYYYQESHVFTNIKGVVVRYGGTTIICLKAALPQREKIATLAHELGHCALDHTCESSDTVTLFEDGLAVIQDPQREHECDIWAAHLLVSPFAFDEILRGTTATTRNQQSAIEDAICVTAHRLNVPSEVVSLWYETRNRCFIPLPLSWLHQEM